MNKLTLLVASLMIATFTFAQQGSMTFAANSLDITKPLDTEANIGYYMTDDIMVSMGMENWDMFDVTARVYTDFLDRAFIQATTEASMVAGERTYKVGAALGWTKPLGIWRLQFEPMIMLDDIQEFDPMLAWGLRFNL